MHPIQGAAGGPISRDQEIASLGAEQSVIAAMVAEGHRERQRQRLALAGAPADRVDRTLAVLERMIRTPPIR